MNLKLIIYILLFISCVENTSTQESNDLVEVHDRLMVGAEQIDEYIYLLEGKNIGITMNQSSRIGNELLLDSLLKRNINVKKVFCPEHGFRGKADAGQKVEDDIDAATRLPIISLYGSNKKPSLESLEGIDLMLFDIQDVGVRFYTYISTLHYVMEACAENDIPLIVLDRPNPNGHYVDGPVLDLEFKSFVGMHQVPVVHGMTIGEYAQMINGEAWLKHGIICDLKVIPLVGYTHDMKYELPVKPSPNLPNYRSILLYPSLCFFEGTDMSIGRGTTNQFQVIGHPKFFEFDFHFTPVSREGAKDPKHKNTICFGNDLTKLPTTTVKKNGQLNLGYLMEFYELAKEKGFDFFTRPDFFDLLAGSDNLRLQIINGKSEFEIKSTWNDELMAFKEIRQKYLLYDD